ncbi:MAG: Maf family protein [Planctomycetota bacterium]|nr:Maf family protein [Planctomycetota bacterium]
MPHGASHAAGDRDLILASASPRRHRLLAEAGVSFRIVPADVDETINLALDAGGVAEDLALRKAQAVADRQGSAGALVLGSDTVVVLGEDGDVDRRFLEKAPDAQEATRMLQALSGTRHRVITGIAVVDVENGAALTDHEVTWVTMRPLDAGEVTAYVASGEWEGKAGAYAIQETADRFVTGLEGGGFDNVVGLPVERTLALLRSVAGTIDPGSGA